MTDDLISRQAAIDAIAEMGFQKTSTVKAILCRLKTLPSAQSERKKGRWIKMSDRDGIYWACSECGEDIPRVLHYNPQFDLFPRLETIEKTKFCPNCGAKMEENR